MLEAKATIVRLLQDIKLTDDEKAAAEEDLKAVENFCERLADVPTPGGPTPARFRQDSSRWSR
jgi:hypothetical protein